MKRNRVALAYTEEYLEIERPQTLSDQKIENLIQSMTKNGLNIESDDSVYENFKTELENYLLSSKLNSLTGLNCFKRVDIIMGCTQYIDTLYMQHKNVQIINGDYRYHQRLNPNLVYSIPNYLLKDIPLIIAMPFPSLGDKHPKMQDILDETLEKNIDVHIDGAWISCARDLTFDFNHPSIKSCAVSLSKGLGLGWNRIGLRYTRDFKQDAITIMNDFHMNNRILTMVGLHFIRSLPIDYLWNTHGERYYKVCKDFNLTPTNSIQLALRDGNPVGIAPLIRYLEEHG